MLTSVPRLTTWLLAALVGSSVAVAVAQLFSGVLALAVAAITGAALGLTVLAQRSTSDDARPLAVAPLLLGITLDTLLAAARLQTGWVEGLDGGWFRGGVAPAEPVWFVALVVAPVSFLLFGAQRLTRQTALGHFLAWWSAGYLLADALWQVRAPVRSPGGVVAGAIALAVLGCVVRVAQQLLAGGVMIEVAPGQGSARTRTLWTVVFVCATAGYGLTLLREAGPLPVGVIVGSMLGGLIGWRRTTAKRPADPAKLVPLLLALLALFYVHVGEEALTSFNRAIAQLTGHPWADHDFTFFIGLAGPVVWFGAAWSLWLRQAPGNFLLWFLIVGMILGEPTHLIVFPLLQWRQSGGGYAYFSGMYTALLPMIPAIVALVTLLRDHREAVA